MLVKNFHRYILASFIILLSFLPAIALNGAPLLTSLSEMGYSVIPTPRKTELSGEELEFSSKWSLSTGALDSDHIAVRTLVKEMKELYGIKLQKGGASGKVIKLAAEEEAVAAEARPELAKQGYYMKITPDKISVTGNSGQGLFYGVQTLIQLLKEASGGRWILPEGEIWDWPSGKLRFLHWDTKNHQDRMKTLKRYLDWSAKFKVNMIGFELADKFAYPSHPVIGAPGAFTPEELQEIVDYARERYIQVVPVIQSPAHMCYVLKHPEFKDIRASCELCPPEGLNYQACLCNEETYDVIFDIFRDVINATEGVDYFHVSTDEVYYAGICDQCEPPYRWEDLSSDSHKSRSRSWARFASRAHDFLNQHDRRMLAWVEYPLLTEDISRLPSSIIDGVQRGSDFIKAEQEIGMEGLIYVSMQGSERLIPRNFATGVEKFGQGGRLQSAFETLSFPRGGSGQNTAWNSDNPPIGVFGAAWDDSGLHNETFWLGWSTVAQYAWTPGTPSVEQHVSEFMDTYYGPDVRDMREIYRGLQKQADFFEESWSEVKVPDLKPIYGFHRKLWETPRTRTRWSLPQPAVPELFVGWSEISIDPVYVNKYADLVEEAKNHLKENQLLREKIMENMARADRNLYNLELLLSLVEYTRHHNRMLISMGEIENKLQSAHTSAGSNNPEEAVQHLVSAWQQADQIIHDRKEMFQDFRKVWEKSRLPKGRSVNGKEYFHELDDIKTHWASITADLSFYIAPEERIGMDEWKQKLAEFIEEYAGHYDISVKSIE